MTASKLRGIAGLGLFLLGGVAFAFTITRSGSDMQVGFTASAGSIYRLERKAQLTDTDWNAISGVNDFSALSSGPAQITDPGALSLGHAFYQVDLVFPLTVSKSGAGAGTVTSNPTGINCGATCALNFPQNTSVALTASPGSGSAFNGWSGSCSGSGCTVAMDAAKAVTANFLLLNNNPSCAGGSNLGSISGDTGTPNTMASTSGEKWFFVRLTENDNSVFTPKPVKARVALTVPADMDYDLYVYCASCGGTLAGSSVSGAGFSEGVDIGRSDTSGTDDSFDMVVEVRYFSGNSPANWVLTITGNTGAASVSCP